MPTTTYLITGASSGIGLELAKRLASRGGGDARVIATCRARASSATGIDSLSEIVGASDDDDNVTVIEGVDVADDGVVESLRSALDDAGVTRIDVVVHNAGSLAGTRGAESTMAEQSLANVTTDRMRAAYEVNALGPLRVQKAVDGLLSSGPDDDGDGGGGRVAVISTGLASIGDNTSGGTYAYRASKAAVNMITKCLSCDLKKRGICVVAVAPGFVATEFGPGKEQMTKWGAMPVEKSVDGIVKILDSMMTMENTGKFFSVKRDKDPEEFPW